MTLLTRLALKRPLTSYVLMAIVVLAGLATYLSLPRESFPEIKIPLILVSSFYAGTSPEDMESQVTRKIEVELKGLSGLKEIRSTSQDSSSVIEVEFNPDVDLDTALQKVRESVDRAKPEMPNDLDDPAITDLDFSRIPILIVNLAGDFGMDRLKEIADDLKDELETIPGVNLVQLTGGRDREVQVFADPRRLTAYKLGLPDLVDAIAREHLTIPGGDLDIGRLNFLVRVPAEVDDPLDIGEFVVELRGSRAIKVRDVATVVFGFEEETTRARMNRRRVISLAIEKRTGANIIEVAQQVKQEVAHFEKELPATAEIAIVGDQSKDIENMVRELENNVLSGLLLVLIVLFLTMGWRPAVIVAAAIPFSMLISFIVIDLFGYTLNMVILFSMVLVLGMLVDNAVVTVENIYRHRELGDDPLLSARAGTGEVTIPIVASTATTLCAFGPMLFWPGIVGEFMKYLPVTLIIGLVASLFVALVFNPAIALVLLRHPPKKRDRAAGERSRVIRLYRGALVWALDSGEKARWYLLRNWVFAFFIGLLLLASLVFLLASSMAGTPLPVWIQLLVLPGATLLLLALAKGLGWVTDHRVWIVCVSNVILMVTLLAYTHLGTGMEFFPDQDPRSIWVDMEFPSGTNLDAQDELVRIIEEKTAGVPDLDTMVANVGSAGGGFEEGGGGTSSNKSRVTLNLEEFRKRSQNSSLTMRRVKDLVSHLTGAQVTVGKPQEGPPTGKPVSIRLISDDYAALGVFADRLKNELAATEGLYNVDHDFDSGYPEIHLLIDREQAARARTNTRDVAMTVRTALAGTEVAKFRTGEDEYEIVVRLPPGDRKSSDYLEELTILDDDGNPIPLASIARIESTAGPAAIRRADLKRVITIQADVDHAAGFRDDVMRKTAVRKIDELGLPPGVRWEFAGSNQDEEEAKEFLTRAFFIALLLIGLILVTEFDSLITPLTILISVVLSLIGVFWGLIITQKPFGIVMTGIGVISLAGIVVNNAIVLLDFVLQERRKGASRKDAILAAGSTRLRPVLLTAITTILGLIPLTVGINIDFFSGDILFGGESSQWWGPMGVAVIFGLTFATVLTLIVVPVTYDILDSISERFTARRRTPHADA